jgi:hypothetical protein
MFGRLRAWWKNRPCYTECFPLGWRSHVGITMTCEECNSLHEIEIAEIRRTRDAAARFATRPDFV